MNADHEAERERQAALLRAVWDAAGARPFAGGFDPTGLAAYQGHARATARAVLRQTYPTVRAMLGEEALDTLAVALWQRHPPRTGDLADWGRDLPEALASQPELAAWPWLADCARLDWARHDCERAADPHFDAPSLARLGDTPPERLRLHLQDHVRVLASPWPLAALFEAHADPAQALPPSLKAPTPSAQPGHTVVWRQPWRAQVMALSPEVGAWTHALHAPCPPTLASLLDQAPPHFDFTAWLTLALQHGWIARASAD